MHRRDGKQARAGAEIDCENGAAARPAVTVGLAVYNGEGHIEHALATLTQQTYPNFTIVVSDNASTDGTWKILQDWAARDHRIVLHRQSTNIGLKANFRYVLEQAETEYFMWHADDDWVAPNYLEELMAVLNADPDCALACPFGVRVDQDDSVLHREAFPALDPNSRLARIRTLLKRPEGVWIYGLLRTEALRQNWKTGESFGYVWASDAVALLELILNDQIRGTERTTFYYRVNYPSLYSLRPDTTLKMLRFLAHYARFHFRLLRTSRLTLWEKLLVAPWVLNHVIVSLFERPYKRFLKQPAKRLLKAVVGWPKRLVMGR